MAMGQLGHHATIGKSKRPTKAFAMGKVMERWI
jgi:hypothetical protein